MSNEDRVDFQSKQSLFLLNPQSSCLITFPRSLHMIVFEQPATRGKFLWAEEKP